MLIHFSVAGRRYIADTARAHDISIPLDFDGEQPNAFHLPRAEARCIDHPKLVGDTRRGGSCNCVTVTLTPHGNCTHTECVGHISRERVALPALVGSVLVPAALISVTPAQASTMEQEDEPFPDGRDRLIGPRALAEAVRALRNVPPEFLRALVVRTLPNVPAKRSANYSGTNPPYFSRAGMRLIRRWGTEHLLCDLPSMDRESDGGALAAHRIFWGAEADKAAPTPLRGWTITELIHVDASAPDGAYLLDLQFSSLLLDAVPSRPLLFPVEEVEPPPEGHGTRGQDA